ncbi:MAG TPA: hypothetical protein VG407_13400 [Caulobacteraceae bacterium]|jgi:hypothetical protein|nr:hypothetical protein [Caulobacteraceae bacterium]
MLRLHSSRVRAGDCAAVALALAFGLATAAAATDPIVAPAPVRLPNEVTLERADLCLAHWMKLSEATPTDYASAQNFARSMYRESSGLATLGWSAEQISNHFASVGRRAAEAPTPEDVQLAAKCGVYVQAEWVDEPDFEAMLMAFPAEAFAKGVGGKGLILCQIEADTTIHDCHVTKEEPPGMGFGAAAVAVIEKGHMGPTTVDGETLPRIKLNLPFTFEYGMAQRIEDAERCLGYASAQAPGDSLEDTASVSWMYWFTVDAKKAGVSGEERDRRMAASVKNAKSALATDKGMAEAAACSKYYDEHEGNSLQQAPDKTPTASSKSETFR